MSSHISTLLFHTGIFQLLSSGSGVPSFTVNLDLPPKQRWVSVVTYYKAEMVAMAQALDPVLTQYLHPARQSWEKVSNFDPEYEEELQGIIDTLNQSKSSCSACTLEHLKLSNMLYELERPTACSGVLWAMPNGTVMHGRNMDQGFHFTMPDGRVLNWPDVTFEATFLKGGAPLYRMTQWPGGIGALTAMRFNGWSFEQNTRYGLNNKDANLQAAQKGGKSFALTMRRIMETTPDYKQAVAKVQATKFMAPQYFIMSGTAPFEGGVITIDRLGDRSPGTPPMQSVNNSTHGWHLVQTNDDLLHAPIDQRRPVAERMLQEATQDVITVDHLMQFLHTPLLFNEGTVFSTVMVPATNYYKTVLPTEPPGPLDMKLLQNHSAGAMAVLTSHSSKVSNHVHI